MIVRLFKVCWLCSLSLSSSLRELARRRYTTRFEGATPALDKLSERPTRICAETKPLTPGPVDDASPDQGADDGDADEDAEQAAHHHAHRQLGRGAGAGGFLERVKGWGS